MVRNRTSYATVLAALAVTWTAQAALGATEFTVDPAHSGVIFKVKHNDMAFVFGRFNELSGKIIADKPYDPSSVEVNIEIETKSIDTNNKERDVHLKSKDFFDTKKNAKITFKGKSTKQLEGGKFELEGELDMRGVKKGITVVLEQTGSRRVGAAYRYGALATFTIKRSDFGMDHDLTGIGDEVTITVSLEGEWKLPPTG